MGQIGMSHKILTFLLIFFSFLAAFMGGYFLSGTGFQKETDDSDRKTGNILDKFDSEFVVSKDDSFQKPSKPSLLSDHKVISFAVANNGSDIVYYEKGTGRALSVSPDTKEEKILSADIFANLIKTVWSSDRKKAINQFYSQSGAKYRYYNFQTKESVNFESNVKSTVFSPDGGQIAKFVFSETENISNIIISNPAGTVSKKIFDTRLSDLSLYWPQDNLLFFQVADNLDSSKLFSLTKEGAVKETIRGAKNLEIQWSQDGQSFLFSTTGKDGRSELFQKNTAKENAAEILLPIAASASKCAWSIDNKTAVCAAPATSGESEELYEINIENNTARIIAGLNPNMRVREIVLSNIGDYAIFLNLNDERLYFLKQNEKK